MSAVSTYICDEMGDEELPKELSDFDINQLFQHAKAGGPPEPVSESEFWDTVERAEEAVAEGSDPQADADIIGGWMERNQELRAEANLVDVPLTPFVDDWNDLDLGFAEGHAALNSRELIALVARASLKGRRVPAEALQAKHVLERVGQIWLVGRDHVLDSEHVLQAYDKLQRVAVTASRTAHMVRLWEVAALVGHERAEWDQYARAGQLGEELIPADLRDVARAYHAPQLYPQEEVVFAVRTAVLLATAVFVADVAEESDLWTILGPATRLGGLSYETLPRLAGGVVVPVRTKEWARNEPLLSTKVERFCRQVARLTERDCIGLSGAHDLWEDPIFRKAMIDADAKLAEQQFPTLIGAVKNALRTGHLPDWSNHRSTLRHDRLSDELSLRSLTAVRAAYYLAVGVGGFARETVVQLTRAAGTLGQPALGE
jgi:hypothetical protein